MHHAFAWVGRIDIFYHECEEGITQDAQGALPKRRGAKKKNSLLQIATWVWVGEEGVEMVAK